VRDLRGVRAGAAAAAGARLVTAAGLLLVDSKGTEACMGI
jgi:hypothetical protein